MPFKYLAAQIGPGIYELPQTGDMRCPVWAFLSPDLYDSAEGEVWRQAYRTACAEGVLAEYLMPDTHTGFGIPIGGVVVTDNTLHQGGSGYDINCGVLSFRIPGLHAKDIQDPAVRLQWIRAVEVRVALGLGSHQPDKMVSADPRLIDEVLRHGAQALQVSTDLCERSNFPVDEAHFNSNRIQRAITKTAPQLGSLGSGNHFIELQCDPKDGSVWGQIHCGSRGYGWQTANYYFYEGARLRGLQPRRREESYLYADEPLGREFWAHHNSAANYAVANRFVILHAIRMATQEVFHQDVEPYYEISHNLIQEERVQQKDGSYVKGFVHRKGATRAFPAGHTELVGSPWFETGHPCLIPGSMMSGAAILFPQEGAWQSACSVNHGSGRTGGSRGDAKKLWRPLQADLDEEMRTIVRVFDGVDITGIVMNTEHVPLDENDHVYKDLDAVLAVLEQTNIATVARRFYPVANIKSV